MKTSENGIKFIEGNEGLRLQAYKDVAGIWTDGYGNTHNVIPGSTITQAKAESDLLTNIAGSEYVVNTVVKVVLTQNQFDALVDFVFNLGSGNFQSSTLLRKLNAGDFSGAALEFPKWNHAGGVVVAGLTTRRLAEQHLFSEHGSPAVSNVEPTLNTGPQESTASEIQNAAQDVTSFFSKIQSDLGNS